MTPEKIALKRDTRELIRGVGGLEAAAGFCRVGKSQLAEYQSVDHPGCWMPLDVLADLEPLARSRDGWPHVARALAALNGFALVKLPDALPAKGELLRLVAAQARDSSDLTTAVCDALADGVVTRAEARAARAPVRDLIAVAVAMDAALAAIETGEGE